MTRDRFATARQVADAVLFEGYVLYPYRASARKNQIRWQFGVLAPRLWAEVNGGERSSLRTEVVVDPGTDACLTVRIRCLQVQRRTVAAAVPGRPGEFEPAEGVDVDGVTVVPWDEAVEHEIDVEPFTLLPLASAAHDLAFELPGGSDTDDLVRADGTVVGRTVHTREPVTGIVRVRPSRAGAPGGLLRVRVDVENTTLWDEPGASRDSAMARSLLAVHTLLAVDDGTFVSLLDPGTSATAAAAGCVNDGTFPVLIGDDVMLSSPIILYDQPEIAPESDGDFCDATEIDEILALRVLTLTDEEKAEARGTDRRAAAIIDRCDDMPPEVWSRLHGAVRSLQPVVDEPPPAVSWWDPVADAEVDPWTDTTVINGVVVGKGTAVRLEPSRRADAHDLFLAGRDATVAGVFKDVDGNEHVAVTLDDDPAAEIFEWQRRFYYFHPEEVVPLRTAEAKR